MISKRRLQIAGAVLLLVAALLGTLMVVVDLYLPRYIESVTIPALSRRTGLAMTATVRGVGLTSADLAGVRIGPADVPLLEVNSVRLDYSLPGLLRQRLKKVVISGVTIAVGWHDGAPLLPSLPLSQPANNDTVAPGSSAAALPLAVDELLLQRGELVITLPHRSLRVPFSFAATLPATPVTPLSASLVVTPAGQKFTLAGRIDPEWQQARLAIVAPAIDAAALAALLPGDQAHPLAGQLALHGSLSATLSPLRLQTVQLITTISGASLTRPDFSCRQVANSSATLQLDRSVDNLWRLHSTGLALASPFAAALDDFDASFQPDDSGGSKAEGHFLFQLLPQDLGPVSLSAPLVMSTTFEADQAQEGGWLLEVISGPTDKEPGQVVTQLGGATLTAPVPELRLASSGTPAAGNFSWQVGIGPIGIVENGDSATVTDLKIAGKGEWPATETGLTTFSLTVPDFQYVKDGDDLRLGPVSLAGMMANVDNQLTWLGRLQVAAGNLQSTRGGGLAANGLHLELPFCFPCQDKTTAGRLTVSDLHWRGQALGGIEAEVVQQGQGLRFSGNQRNLLLPGLVAEFAGEVTAANSGGVIGAGSFAVPRYQPVAPVDLGVLLPAATGITVSGDLTLDGKWNYSHCGFNGSLQAGLTEGALRAEDRGLALEGMHLQLRLEDLAGMRSEPRQQFRFQRATLGDLEVTDGVVDFRLESAESVLIERGRCQWCMGHVDIRSLRITPGSNTYDMVFYCDRLHFASVLGQLGAATSAAGDGRVNGRIALHIDDGKLRFDDGFLFSTPGQGGTIRLTGADRLTEGIAPGTQQFAQVDLAREALSDYLYDWARLGVSSDGDDLLLRLQLNGRPAKPLPFVFRKELGGFARVEAGSSGSRFEGIRLDVNFRLPLDTVLDYGSSIQKMLR